MFVCYQNRLPFLINRLCCTTGIVFFFHYFRAITGYLRVKCSQSSQVSENHKIFSSITFVIMPQFLIASLAASTNKVIQGHADISCGAYQIVENFCKLPSSDNATLRTIHSLLKKSMNEILSFICFPRHVYHGKRKYRYFT